jgi:glycosyltransferase involved in cell wall biosynthesis
MLVSVVIPTYNRAVKLIEAIESVQAQTYPLWEIVVVDDGSTDSTRDQITRRFGDDKRVRYTAQENRGASAARNRAIQLAKGEIVAFLDSDDLYFPSFLERHIEAYGRHPEADIVFSDLEKQTGAEILPRFMERTAVFKDLICDLASGEILLLPQDVMKQVLLQEIPIKMPGTTVRSKVFRAYGLFDEEIKVSEDWVFMLQRADDVSFAYINEVLGRIRISDDSLHLLLEEQDHVEMIDRLMKWKNGSKQKRERRAARSGIIHLYKALYWHYCRVSNPLKAVPLLIEGARRTHSVGLLLRAFKAGLAALTA